jgi:multiple RNA-binding domain-containing protein 1
LIVKNLPKHLTEQRLKEHFQTKGGLVTDAKIMKKGDKSRLFGFVGFRTELEAEKAKKFFGGTFLDTSRLVVDFAKPQGDPELPRAWSKHSKGSSAYQALHGQDENGKAKVSEEERERKNEEIEKKKSRFREFLKVIGASKDNKQSWNDNFSAFMADEGSGLLHTSKVDGEKKSKRKAKEEDKAESKKPEEPEATNTVEDKDLIDEQRLYVMNLPFTITHDDLRERFGKYGEIQDIEVPLRKGTGGLGLGIAFIRYETIEGAVSAFAELDKTYYQGRKLHILPAQKKPPKPITEEMQASPENED